MRFILSLLCALMVMPVGAQTPDAKASREIFQDWELNCAEKGELKRCSINQRINNANGQVAAAATASLKDQQVVMEFALPLMLDLTTPVTIQVDARPTQQYPFNTCNQAACFVVRAGDKALVNAFQAGSEATIAFKSFAAQNVNVKLSLKGFGAALKALESQK